VRATWAGMTVPLNGGSPVALAPARFCAGIAADGRSVYWTALPRDRLTAGP
jgi:hypothetical protein